MELNQRTTVMQSGVIGRTISQRPVIITFFLCKNRKRMYYGEQE